MSTHLYLVRHGETVLNKTGVYYGATDCSLSEEGLFQSQELSNILIDSIEIIISSPLSRAIETAMLISKQSQEKLVIDEGLREIDFGLWEGMGYKEISVQYESEWNSWTEDWINVSPPNGESFISQYHRVSRSLKNILNEYKDKKIMIVSHQGCLRIIASILLNMEERSYWNFTFEHGAYSLFEIVDEHLTIRKINCKG